MKMVMLFNGNQPRGYFIVLTKTLDPDFSNCVYISASLGHVIHTYIN